MKLQTSINATLTEGDIKEAIAHYLNLPVFGLRLGDEKILSKSVRLTTDRDGNIIAEVNQKTEDL